MRFLMLCVALFATCFQINAQTEDSRNALINYSFNIETGLVKGLDPFEAVTDREKRMLRKANEQRQKQCMDATFTALLDDLKGKQIGMLPVNSMEGTVKYHQEYPFPLIPKQAVKKHAGENRADYYFNLNVTLTKTMLGGIFGVKPKANVRLVVFDPAGNKVKEVKGKAKAAKNVRIFDFPGKTFDKIDLAYVEPFVESMMPTIEAAIDNTVRQF